MKTFKWVVLAIVATVLAINYSNGNLRLDWGPKPVNYRDELAKKPFDAVRLAENQRTEASADKYYESEFRNEAEVKAAQDQMVKEVNSAQDRLGEAHLKLYGYDSKTVPGAPVPQPGLPAGLPPTPTSVSCTEQNGQLVITWPTTATDWVKVCTMKDGQIVTADPNGRAFCHPELGAKGPQGTNMISSDPTYRQLLPVPDAPVCAVVVKLVNPGDPHTTTQPLVLAGSYARVAKAFGDRELYVRVNDLDQPEYVGVRDNEGSFPLIIK